jgi:hypothetical protein
MNNFFKKPFFKLAAAAVFLLFLGLVFFLRSRPVWYVEAPLASAWARVLRQSSPPFARIKAASLKDGRRPGFLITSADAAVLSGASDSAYDDRLVRFEGLSGGRECNGALLLALDPWLVFFKHTGSVLRYDRVEAPGEGNLILSGAESDAIWAWTAQLAQHRSGDFTEDQKFWNDAARHITEDPRFQPDAKNCAWPEAFSLLLRDGDAWLYAPLSKVLELPSHRTGMLTARHFPVPRNWNQYGIQAALLWAIPPKKESRHKKLAAAEAWLKDPQTQALIARELNWLPAHPESSPYNPLYRDSQLAWLGSSAVWHPRE